ncbi:MAG: RNA polymerase factor sigma-32, partial [Polyangiaceae bacterium]
MPRAKASKDSSETPKKVASAATPKASRAPSAKKSAAKASKRKAPEDTALSRGDDEGQERGERARADHDSDDGDVVEAAGEVVDDESGMGELAHQPREPKVSADERGLAKFDAMTAYQREIQRHPLLSPEETHSLAVDFVKNQNPQVAARLVTANLRLVVKIAYEYRRAYKNIMDLVQEGNIGLMQAVKRYDPYRGVKLSSYAAYWIRAYILRFILNNWRLVKLGTTQAQRKLFFNLRKKRAELISMGVDPTNAEIAKQLNVPENEVAEMDVRLAASEKSLDAPVGDSDGRAIAKVDMMPSAGASPDMLVEKEEIHALLTDKLKTFRETLIGKEKELAIFDQRLVAEDPLTLQELGDKFKISRERVRQLEQRLTGRLREYLTN